MKNFIKIFLLFLLSTVLHWAFASAGAEAGIGINLMLVFAFAVCVFTPPAYGYTFAFLSGLFLDSFGTQMFGLYGLIFVLVARIAYLLARNMDFQNALTQFMAVFLLSIFTAAAYSALGLMFIKGGGWSGFKTLIFGSAINGCLAPIMFYVFNKIRLEREK